MALKPSHWHGSLVLLVCAVLTACSPGEQAEQLVASAEHARRNGQLTMAAELYHQAAEIQPYHFQTHYRAALLSIQVENMHRAEEPLRKDLALNPTVGPVHVQLGAVFLRPGRGGDGPQ